MGQLLVLLVSLVFAVWAGFYIQEKRYVLAALSAWISALILMGAVISAIKAIGLLT